MLKKGDLVRYRTEWCNSPEEREYIHAVIEQRLNPITGEMTRYLIATLNTSLILGATEVVDACMIESA